MTFTTANPTDRSRPTLHMDRRPEATTTHVFLGGIGPGAGVLFGGLRDGELDPASYAEMFISDNRLLVDYAGVYDERKLFDVLYERLRSLRGDVELHLLSAGAAIGQRFIEYCAQYRNAFTITGVTFINPAAGLDGLQPAQRKLVGLCRWLKQWPRVYRSSLVQRIWSGFAWKIIWPASKHDQHHASWDKRTSAFRLYRQGQRDCLVSTIVSTTAAMDIDGFGQRPAKPDYQVRIIVLMQDRVLRARANIETIHHRYKGEVVVFPLDGPPQTCGSHDSLLIFPGLYRHAYHQLTIPV